MVPIRVGHKPKSDLPRVRSPCSRLSFLLSDESRKKDMPVHPPPLHPNTFLFLPETRFYLFSPLKSPQPDPLGGKWLARTSPLWSTECRIFNPLNVDDYFYSDPPVEAFIDLLDTHVLELSRMFFLLEDDTKEAKPISKKAVGGWNTDSDYLFGVLALLESQKGGGLWMWRFNDAEWIKIEGTGLEGEYRIGDIAYHDGKFYALELSTWRIGVIDPKSDSVSMEFIDGPSIPTDPSGDYYFLNLDGQLHYLGGVYFVPSNGQLYLLIEVFPKAEDDNDGAGSYNQDNRRMIVYVMNQQRKGGEEEGQTELWKRVKNIGDQIFFVGYDTSFALPSSSINLPQWKPSSICLFTRPFPLLYDGFFAPWGQKSPEGLEPLKRFTYPEYWRYFRLFEMRDDEEEKSIVRFDKLPGDVYAGLFFPPPSWVQWKCPDHNNAEINFENVKFNERNMR